MSQASVIRKKAKASLPVNVINLKAKNMLLEISEEEEEQQQQWENHVLLCFVSQLKSVGLWAIIKEAALALCFSLY